MHMENPAMRDSLGSTYGSVDIVAGNGDISSITDTLREFMSANRECHCQPCSPFAPHPTSYDFRSEIWRAEDNTR